MSQQFRHGRPQAGRLREFRQFGVETIGSGAPNADVEVIVLGGSVPPRAWPPPGRAARQLDRRRRVPAGLPREADRVPRTAQGGARRGLPDAAADQPASRVRLQGRRADAARARGAGRSPRTCARPCAEHFAAVRNGLDAAPGSRSCTTRGSSEGSTTTRGRRSSSCRSALAQAQARARRRRAVRRARRGARRTADPRDRVRARAGSDLHGPARGGRRRSRAPRASRASSSRSVPRRRRRAIGSSAICGTRASPRRARSRSDR